MWIATRCNNILTILNNIKHKNQRQDKYTHLLQSEDHRDFLLCTSSNEVIRKQLSCSQKLIISALVNENVQLWAGVGTHQDCSIIALQRQ